MGIVGWIIVGFILLGVIASLFEWIFDHLVQVLVCVITVVGLIFWTKGTIIMAGIAGVAYAIYYVLAKNGAFNLDALKSRRLEKKKAIKAGRELREKRLEEQNQISQMPDPAKDVIEEIDRFKNGVNEIRKEINDSDMLDAIDDFNKTIDDLRAKVLGDPERADKMQRLVNYYLPTTSKLLKKYVEYSKNTSGDSSKITAEIKGTVISLDRALEKLHQELSITDDWDVLSDIAVMKQMIENDGLSDNETKLMQ